MRAGAEGSGEGPDREVDARDLLCPLPVLCTPKALEAMRPGQVLRVLATDAMAAIDQPHFCAEAGHEHLGLSRDGGAQVHLIRRGSRTEKGPRRSGEAP